MKKVQRISVVLLCWVLTLVSPYALAECETIDYSYDVGPVRNQGEKEWCYAYTVADLLTQKLRQAAPKYREEQVSAMDVAYQYFITPATLPSEFRTDPIYPREMVIQREVERVDLRQTDIQLRPRFQDAVGGFLDFALQEYGSNGLGFCLEKNLSSEISAIRNLTTLVQNEFKFQASQNPKIQSDKKLEIETNNDIWATLINRQCQREKVQIRKSIHVFDGINGRFTRSKGFMYSVVNSQRQSHDVTEKVRNELKRTVNEGLEHGSIVAIDIASGFLFQRPSLFAQGAGTKHSISVVARHKIDNQCYYKLRNSFGIECSHYNTKYNDRCTKGYLWIPEDELFPNVFRALYLN